MPVKLKNKIKEVTLDMAGNMGLIAKKSFLNAAQVINLFRIQKLALDTLQGIRIKHPWEALDKENDEIEEAKKVHRFDLVNRYIYVVF